MSDLAAAVDPGDDARRVALIHYTAPPVVGGVERVLGWHGRLLADAGHRVTIIAGRGSAIDPRQRLDSVPLIDTREPRIRRLREQLDAGRVPASFGPLVEELSGQLRALLDEQDIVIAHNVCSLHLNLALTAALHALLTEGLRARFVAWHHDLAVTQASYREALHPGFPWDLLRKPWPGVVHVSVSQARRAELTEHLGIPPADIQVIHNGLDIGHQLGLTAGTLRLIERLQLLEADPLILTPARILPRKNVELALEVLASLRRLGRPAVLLVTGPVDPHAPDGPGYLDSLLALRSGLGLDRAARFLAVDDGDVPSDRVMADLYRIADVLLLPSHEEGFGLPVLEAALHRLPIVATDLPALREVAGEAATWVDPADDPAAVARRLLERLDGDAVASLWRRVRREYSWEAVYRDHIAPLLAAGGRLR
jgi:mannosylglucosylglycerate synthase